METQLIEVLHSNATSNMKLAESINALNLRVSEQNTQTSKLQRITWGAVLVALASITANGLPQALFNAIIG